jgi:subtilisin family serine protease
VGIIDTGIDASHPDIAPNFDAALSRNFTVDIPLVDGPCEDEPDQSCNDPADVDEGGHGTHTAGTVAAAFNGLGVAGVAPDVTLVNLRAGQDSGYFFLQPTVDALTYAGDIGVDVVNMSFFIDPWWMNCPNNSADSSAEQQEQRTIIKATKNALKYAHDHGVTLIGSAGNEHTDLGKPKFDSISPDFPPGSEKTRIVDNSCMVLPTEGPNVISVVALGPSTRKSYYSNYGTEQAAVSAPGGDARDYFGTPQYLAPENRILSTYPEAVLAEAGLIDEDGNPTTPLVVKNCDGGVCAYYLYLQGTSMASPHAVGVAALIVSAHGVADPVHGGLMLDPATVESILYDTATDQACPKVIDYPDLPSEYTARCSGSADFNGFYGNGIVNALAAVS